MDNGQKLKLQKLIDKTVKTSTAFHLANASLMDFCRDRYGFEPGDVDADEIIDGVLGGCGVPNGMAAEEFERIMRDAEGSLRARIFGDAPQSQGTQHDQ